MQEASGERLEAFSVYITFPPLFQNPITEALHIVTVHLRRQGFRIAYRIMLTVKKQSMNFCKGGERKR